jgi:thymidylate kinase
MKIGGSTASEPVKSSSQSPETAQAAMAVRALFEALNGAGIRYCHWKSNWKLAEAMRGDTDIDLLVDRSDAARFQSLIASFGYKPGVGDASPSICHYYGLDEAVGRLVHLHVYYRIITGGTVLKNHRLALEHMLLAGARPIEGVFVPQRTPELVCFVVRKTLEYVAIIEALLLAREGKSVARELAWLSEGVSDDEIARLLRDHLPMLDLDLWRRCQQAIVSASTVRRYSLARALASRLRSNTRYGRLQAMMIRSGRVLERLALRLRGTPSGDVLLSGGAVIAVVGSDGAGKSTIVGELAAWLGECLTVRSIHAGKPPPSPMTLVPRLLLPLLRRLTPRYRTTSVEMAADETSPRGPAALRRRRLFLLYPLRALMLAHERKRLLIRAHRQAARGMLVVSDRYPTSQRGVPEGPALAFLLDDRNPLYAWLARLEERAYRAIPPPDVVLRLEVSVDLACHRNLTRDKPGGPKPTPYIRRRHAQSSGLDFASTAIHPVNTASGLAETLRSVKGIVWRAL